MGFMDDINKAVGNRIRIIRERADLTQEALGDIIGVEKATVSKYESGATKISYASLLKIAELGKVSLDWLIKGADLPTQPSPYVNEPITDYGPQMAAIRRIVKIIEGHPGCESEVQNLLIDHFYAEKKEERKQEE